VAGSQQTKTVPSLTRCCHSVILRYTHHVIWRRVDPPNPCFSLCYRPADLKMPCPLPDVVDKEQKDPELFRRQMLVLRRYFSDHLVRPVHEALAAAAVNFVFENRLKGGDVLLSLVFNDKHSRSLQISAKHIVYRKWSLRENRTLHRIIGASHKLTKVILPGKGDDRILAIVAENCPALEELDVSNSFITDKGLLSICGVTVTEVAARKRGFEEVEEEEQERGEVDRRTGKFVRAAAARAKVKLDRVRDDPSFMVDLATGRGAASLLRHKFSSLTARMKPYMDARSSSLPSAASCSSASCSALSHSWNPQPGRQYTFSGKGCRQLKMLDINRTNYPKRTIDASGEVIVDLGLTRDSVLCAAILLQELRVLRWTELGEILQLLEMVYGEAGIQPPKLNLTFLCDNRLTIDKLEVAKRICPKIKKLDISMFNFSFDDQDEATAAELSKSSAMYFEFEELRDLEVQYLDDSKTFRTSIESMSANLTRICLNKMMSISFETLSAIKINCGCLNTLEVYVDNIFVVNRQMTLDQAAQETFNPPWPSLKSLKLGGMMTTGSVLKYLLEGCLNIRVLCYSLYEDQEHLVTDAYVQQLLLLNPMPALVAFYFEKCVLTEESFFLLVHRLPSLRFLGILSEWGLDRKGRLAIESYIRGNNLALDVSSVLDGSGYRLDSPVQDLASSLA